MFSTYEGPTMKQNTVATVFRQAKHQPWSCVLLFALLSALTVGHTAQAQSAALQYVPIVSTYAGGASSSTICANATDTLGDGCIATSAILNGATTGDADAAGNVYLADAGNNVIRRIDAVTGIITLVAGEVGSTAVCSGATDTIGNGCLATQAPLNNPRCVRIDRAGNIVIADVGNQVIRRIDKATGMITLLMGSVGKTTHTTPKNTSPSTPLTTTLYNPYNFVFDPAGNMIVTNSTGDFLPIAIAVNGIIDPNTSKVYNLAGTGAASTSAATDGNGGLASAATFATPRGLALDAAGNVYVGDYNDQQVRLVSSPGMNGQVTVSAITAGTVVNFAGNGTQGTSGNGGLATSAEVSYPQGVGLDNAGNVYIEQYSSGNDYIRMVNPNTGIITNYAGTGPATFTGDGGSAASATFYTPTALKFNLGNRMTVYDQSNNRIRNIYATPFFSAINVGSSASQNAAVLASAVVTPATASVSNSDFSVGDPSGCTLGSSLASGTYCTFPLNFTPGGPGLRAGQLQITDSNSNIYNDALLGVGLAPAAAFYGAPLTTLVGNGTSGSSGNGGLASSALVNSPRGGAFDSYGNFYFADSGNHVVRKISKSTGMISLVAGNGTAGFAGDSSAATMAQLNAPTGVAIDPAGNIYIADTSNNRIREVNSSTGLISTIAGTGVAGYTGDTGLATAATLNHPQGIAIDNAGTLYIADTQNHALRAFSPLNGVIVTLVGNGTAGYSGDGGVPQLAELNAPTAVTVDLSGNIYVADKGNAVIRQIVPIVFGIINFQGTINTYAGIVGGTANTGDGGAAIAAGLLTPSGVAVDAAGNLYIAAGGQVRMVSTSGTIITIAGTGASGTYSGENGSAMAAVIPLPAQDLTADQVGNIYLSDTAGNRILLVAGSSAATLQFGSQTIATASSPQTITVYNSGNQSLNITNISMPAGYSLSTANSNACGNTTILTPSDTCTLSVTFMPTSVANYFSQITITDNALNNSAATQTISLAGTGVGHLDPTTTTLTYSPSIPTYGQTVILTATVAGGTSPSGAVNFVINAKTTVSASLINGQATYQLTGLMAGSDNVTVNYLGDSVNAGSSSSVTFAVQKAVLMVTANSLSKYPTESNPALAYTITGFVNNDTAAKVVSGTPILSTTVSTTSPAGTYPITISQGTLAATNYTFVFVAGTLTVLPPTFTLSVSPSSLIIVSGQAGAVIVTVTPTAGYNGTVTLACTGLPSNAVGTFNTTSLTIDPSGSQQTQFTISTNNHPEVGALRRGHLPGHCKVISLALGLPFLSFWMLSNTKRRFHLRLFLLILFLGASVHGLTGCAPATQTAGPFNGSITITATDGAAQISIQTPLGLTIQ